MLTSLEIENFKGIAARQRIDFAPLTLLFGANSAGKSSILQALVYLHELIERGSADVDRTELGGHVLELGGFARLVHQHDTARRIMLRAEFATPGGFGRDLTDFPFPDLDDEVESAWLELTIEHRTTTAFRGPIVSRVRIGVNGDSEPLVWLEVGATMREGSRSTRGRTSAIRFSQPRRGSYLVATRSRPMALVAPSPRSTRRRRSPKPGSRSRSPRRSCTGSWKPREVATVGEAALGPGLATAAASAMAGRCRCSRSRGLGRQPCLRRASLCGSWRQATSRATRRNLSRSDSSLRPTR